jgi:mannosyltransferase OCH1-like enzyme
MIPKKLWQTHKTKLPPIESLECISSWFNKNPDYEWYYMDDTKCEQFIKDHFSEEFYSMYKSLPYGVMKSDTWRIAVVYVYGGVYADLDTECVVPIDLWANDKDLIVSYEPPTVNGIANFVFASSPKHPALLHCLQHLLINYNGPNYLDKLVATGTPIQNFGQDAFYSGIKKYIQSNPKDDKVKIFSVEDNAFTPFKDHKTLVHHKTGSMFWRNKYDSWRRKQFEDFGY